MASAAIVERLKRMESITVRLGSRVDGKIYGKISRSYGSSRMRTQPAASQPATMPLLAFNRKDTAWRIEWQERQGCRRPPAKAFTVAVSWPASLSGHHASRNRGHIAS